MIIGYLYSSFYGRRDMSGKLIDMMASCNLCPRRCGVNRLGDEVGYCGIGADARVSSYGPHFGEEAELVGKGGSGTIFFAGCNLRCIFCQNHDISQEYVGADVSIDELVDIMMALERQGAANINFVSPSHVAAHVAEVIERARGKGLSIPTVYNTGGYDSIETLRELEGLIDIYMPDIKYSDGAIAKKLSGAEDYPEVNRSAVKEMHRQVGDLAIEDGVAVKGLLVRHLVLPNGLAGSFEIIDFLAEEVSANTAINVMAQYRPCWHAGLCKEVNRYPKAEEIAEVQEYAKEKGLRVLL
jgi:putative pyruvate formate lyase activating enzyme